MSYCLKIGKSPQKKKELFSVSEGLPSNNITALATDSKGKTYIGTDCGLVLFDGKNLAKLDVAENISMLYADDKGGVWAGAGNSLHYLKVGKISYTQEFDSEAIGIDTDDVGKLWLVTRTGVYFLEGKSFVFYQRTDSQNVTAMAVIGDGCVYTGSEYYLLALRGKRPHWFGVNPDSSRMPAWNVTALAADNYNHLWVGTDEGLCVYDGRNEWRTYDNTEALPKTAITKLLLGKNGTVYIGTKIGLYILDGVRKSFIGAERWIPHEEVTAISASADGKEFWVGTSEGASRITIEMMTLGEKADHFQKNVEKYNVREGYVMHRELSEKGKPDSGEVYVSDNDGLWTSTYLAAQSFRYGATKNPEALELARRSVKALFKLMDITGVKGFMARSYRRPGEHRYGDGDPEWHRVEDEHGPLEWKCETSSDETSGYFYGLSLFYDICADEKEKEEVKNFLCTLLDYIIENNYTLHDVDGKPTTWAVWTPDILNHDDKWFWEKGTNSLEMLSYLKTCYHVSGDEKYQEEYLKLVRDHHFALNCIQYKIDDKHVTHIDDHLTFIVMPALLRYEKDPSLRQIYLMGLHHHWESQRIERCPYWNVFYGAMTGEYCDLENAVKSLEEIPLDLTTLPVTNSKRPDIVWSEGQDFYGGGPQLVAPLPYDEKIHTNYDGNPFRPDGGNGLRYWDATNIFLVPYWAARYFGMIED